MAAPFGRLVLQNRIGQGSFGAVYAGLKLKAGTEQSRASARMDDDDPGVAAKVVIKQVRGARGWSTRAHTHTHTHARQAYKHTRSTPRYAY